MYSHVLVEVVAYFQFHSWNSRIARAKKITTDMVLSAFNSILGILGIRNPKGLKFVAQYVALFLSIPFLEFERLHNHNQRPDPARGLSIPFLEFMGSRIRSTTSM